MKDGSFSDVLLDCFHLWVSAFKKALSISTPVVIFLWMYLSAALYMTQEDLDSVENLLYLELRIAFGGLFFYGFVALYAVLIYGVYFCERALKYFLFPGMLLSIFVEAFFETAQFGIILALLVIVVSILIVMREKLPQNASPLLCAQYDRIHGMSKSLAKIVAVLGFVFIILGFLFTMFLNSPFTTKLGLRFIVLPLMVTACNSIQMYLLKLIPTKHVDFAIPVISMSHGILKIFERLFTNTMFDSGEYASFVLTTMFAAIMEILNHTTYFHRASVFSRLMKSIRAFGENHGSTVRSIYVDRIDESDVNTHEIVDQKGKDWVVTIWTKTLLEDIVMEIIMIFSVTFLLYFTHPLTIGKSSNTIQTMENCLVQLAIQISFEFICDIFGLYWATSKHGITVDAKTLKFNNQYYWLWIFFTLFQSLQILYFLLVS